MKSAFFILTALLSIGAYAAYNPFTDGAAIDVVISVKDEDGLSVSNAEVRVCFLVDPMREEVCAGIADSEGRYVAKSRACIGTYNVAVRKNGFYETVAHCMAQELPHEVVAKTRKWADSVKHENIVVRAVRKPVKMLHRGNAGMPYPATNEVLRFDMERFDWCPPFGKGRHGDVHVVFEERRGERAPTEFSNNLRMMFPNCADGFYRERLKFPCSRFKYAYHADETAEYEKELHLRFGRTASAITNDVRLAKDEYLVYRVRTRTNELGQVTFAHYGMIREGFNHLIRLKMSSHFNPAPNDTNLEPKR